MLYTFYMFYHYIIDFIASHCSHSTHFSPLTHAAPDFIYTSKLTCFPALPGWACTLQFNKHPYGSHLVLIFTFYWCCTSSSPRKGSTTLYIYEGDTNILLNKQDWCSEFDRFYNEIK